MFQKLSSSFPQLLGVVFLVALAFIIWSNPGVSKESGANSLAAVGASPFSMGTLSSEEGTKTLFTVSCPWVSAAQLQTASPQVGSCEPASCPETASKVADGGCVVTSVGSNGGGSTSIHTAGYCYRICSSK